MKIYAFQGYRFADAAQAELAAAPPFDQIDAALQERLHALSPLQFSHLTRPAPPAGESPYMHSRCVHEEWLSAGSVVREERPSLYPYAIEMPGGRRRLGLTCLVAVDPARAGDLKPHEETVDKPLEDRLALLEELRIDLEPVFYLAEDEAGELDRMLAEDTAEDKEALVHHRDPVRGDRHVLYKVNDGERIAAYQKLLDGRLAAIADGHHRTKVSQLFAARHQSSPGTAAAAKLAVLTSAASQDLTIDPIHRALKIPCDFGRLAMLAAEQTSSTATSGGELAASVAKARQPALGVWKAGREPQLWRLDPDLAPEDSAGRKSGLSVVLLHQQLLEAVGIGAERGRDGSILYRADPDEVAKLLQKGEAEAGFFLPPMDPQAFAEATARGDLMPPKSTRFLPKLVSGLVWVGHDAALV